MVAIGGSFSVASLVLSGCGLTTPTTASNPTMPPVAVSAPCTNTAVLVAIRAMYDTATTKATLPSDTSLVCAEGYAKITIFIAMVPTPTSGPLGSPHLVLLENQSGKWIIANDKLCSSSGKPTKTLPPTLGTVCGVQ
jgi:hypothetical protein